MQHAAQVRAFASYVWFGIQPRICILPLVRFGANHITARAIRVRFGNAANVLARCDVRFGPQALFARCSVRCFNKHSAPLMGSVRPARVYRPARCPGRPFGFSSVRRFLGVLWFSARSGSAIAGIVALGSGFGSDCMPMVRG